MRPTLPLPTTEYLRECFEYDPETGSMFWKIRPRHHFGSDRMWRSTNTRLAGRAVGSKPLSTGYRYVRVADQNVFLHRVIFKMMTGLEPPQVDHINLLPGDNRWANLREADNARNMRNSVRGNRILPKGVTLVGSRYKARINHDGRQIHLGFHPSAAAAHAAYVDAGRELHGEFFRPSRSDA